jgi:MerR family transcriptional regulator, redox-sensitive transcriptional activator SoxR
VGEWPELPIGEVAARAGVATSTVRYYESLGLLPEPERSGGERRYDEGVLGTLAFIGVAKAAGFKLREVKDLIDGVDGERELAETLRSLSSRKLPQAEAELRRAEAVKQWLHVASSCGCATPQECSLFSAGEVSETGEPLPLVQVPAGDCRR